MIEPPSPCNQICRIAPETGWCEGCGRSLQEIAAWPGMSAQEKQALLHRLAERRRI